MESCFGGKLFRINSVSIMKQEKRESGERERRAEFNFGLGSLIRHGESSVGGLPLHTRLCNGRPAEDTSNCLVNMK